MTSVFHAAGEPPKSLVHAQMTKESHKSQISAVEFHLDPGLNQVSLFKNLRTICSNPDPHQAVQGLHSIICNYPRPSSIFQTTHCSLRKDTGCTSVDNAALYAMRDAVQWWRHWHGSLEGHYWQHVYVAFSTISEDVTVPPFYLLNGDFRLLGHSVAEMWDGMRQENIDSDSIAFMELSLLRQYIVQFFNKQEIDINARLSLNPALATNWRDFAANTHGVTVALLTAHHKESIGIFNAAVHMTLLVDILSMSLVGKAIDIDMGTSSFRDKKLPLERAFPGVYLGYMECLNIQPSAPILARSVSSGKHFVPTMDGYRERVKRQRFPIFDSMRRALDFYVKK